MTVCTLARPTLSWVVTGRAITVVRKLFKPRHRNIGNPVEHIGKSGRNAKAKPGYSGAAKNAGALGIYSMEA